MRHNKRCLRLIIIALLLGTALSGAVFAEAPPHEPPPGSAWHTPSSLIIGVPYEDAGAIQNAGVINLLAARPGAGLMGYMNTYFAQDNQSGTPEQNDFYGKAVAAGDFDGNGSYDIAIGVPGEAGLNVIYRFSDGSRAQVYYEGADTNCIFGDSLIAGDFDGDGIDDLAVGAPGCHSEAGSVFVFWGDPEGGLWQDRYTQFRGSNREHFGAALAREDFDANGIYDLVIGSPNADTGAGFLTNRSGKVTILYGPLTGSLLHKQEWTQSATGQGVSEVGDEFGAALSTGDFDGNGRPDLAIGVPGEDQGNIQDTGAFNILYNAGTSLTTANAEVHFIYEARANDRAGAALAAGYFNGDANEDLAVGVPYRDYSESNPAHENTGQVTVLFGTRSSGLGGSAIGVVSNPQYKLLGFSLTAGDFNGDDFDDLVMGIPEFSSSGHVKDGAIKISYGAAYGFEKSVVLTQQDLAQVAAEDDDYFGFALAELPASHPEYYSQFTPLIFR
jgi:hypothetical protein